MKVISGLDQWLVGLGGGVDFPYVSVTLWFLYVLFKLFVQDLFFGLLGCKVDLS